MNPQAVTLLLLALNLAALAFAVITFLVAGLFGGFTRPMHGAFRGAIVVSILTSLMQLVWGAP